MWQQESAYRKCRNVCKSIAEQSASALSLSRMKEKEKSLPQPIQLQQNFQTFKSLFNISKPY